MPSSSGATELSSYGGTARSEITRRTGCSSVHLFDNVPSTMDIAHELASAGAESGTLVVALTQSAGRGREGRSWQSGEDGVWLTFVSRNAATDAAQVLSIRAGILLRGALAALTTQRLTLKWPNDLLSDSGKLAGVLVETRWREGAPEWTAIGVGVNLKAPDNVPDAGALGAGVDRIDVLYKVVSAVREAANAEGALSRDEVQEYMRHDALRGRKVSAPAAGVVVGISEDGELVVSNDDGIQTARSGSVVLEEDE